jgi:hypothetical protein
MEVTPFLELKMGERSDGVARLLRAVESARQEFDCHYHNAAEDNARRAAISAGSFTNRDGRSGEFLGRFGCRRLTNSLEMVFHG